MLVLPSDWQSIFQVQDSLLDTMPVRLVWCG